MNDLYIITKMNGKIGARLGKSCIILLIMVARDCYK